MVNDRRILGQEGDEFCPNNVGLGGFLVFEGFLKGFVVRDGDVIEVAGLDFHTANAF